MKKTIAITVLLAAALGGSLTAATLTTLPTTGLLTGAPGETVGWGFSATNDSFTQPLSFSQSILVNETNPLLGTYTDLIGPSGGPDNFFVDAGETWSEAFDLTNQIGLGSYTIDPNAVVGSFDSGVIRAFFNYADSTPGSLDVPFIVEVVAPEPSTWATISLAGGVLIVYRVRRKLERTPRKMK